MKRLENKVALITGAAMGMGAAEACLFAEEGALLVLTDINAEKLAVMATELESRGAQVLALRQDVSDEADWQKAAREAEARFGRVDVLVNNAGIVDQSGVEATTKEIWDRVIAVNQTGTWLGMKYIAPLLRKAGGGSIVNISSIYGLIGSGTSTAYQASKGAVRILSKTAAMEFAPMNIRVNTIFPGAIATPMVESVDPETLKHLLALIPMRRMGTALEIAKAALFLASDESSYMTGAELVIDGGWTIP
jgi:NAD(P)-dependent dehydrogenase (short-subunit alcohol dehydrogenase family)